MTSINSCYVEEAVSVRDRTSVRSRSTSPTVSTSGRSDSPPSNFGEESPTNRSLSLLGNDKGEASASSVSTRQLGPMSSDRSAI